MEGVWKNRFEWTGGVVYEIGITQKNNHEYIGFVITSNSTFWQPKEVKFKLFPMTNPIRTMGVEYQATQTLIDGLESYIKTVKDKKEKEDEIKMLRGWIASFEKNMGKFVNVSDNPVSIVEVDVAPQSPRNVVLMIDKKVGSSAENLVIKAKQSVI